MSLKEVAAEIRRINREKAKTQKKLNTGQTQEQKILQEIKTNKGHYRQEYVTDGKKKQDGTPYGKLYGPYWFYYYYNNGKLHKKYIGKNLVRTIP